MVKPSPTVHTDQHGWKNSYVWAVHFVSIIFVPPRVRGIASSVRRASMTTKRETWEIPCIVIESALTVLVAESCRDRRVPVPPKMGPGLLRTLRVATQDIMFYMQ